MRTPVHEARLNNAIETRIYALNDRNVVTECTETVMCIARSYVCPARLPGDISSIYYLVNYVIFSRDT